MGPPERGGLLRPKRSAKSRRDSAADVDVEAVRTQLRLSQAELAQRYAVSRRSLQKWERGGGALKARYAPA